MAFSQSSITAGPTLSRSGRDLLITWSSSAAAGTTYQVYRDRNLAWSGTELRALLPWPAGPARYEVGTVGVGEARTDFSGSLPAAPPDRAILEWDGGTWQSPDLAGFHIYSSSSPGGAVDMTDPVATVPFATGPLTYDGYGAQGYGVGGYGTGNAHFSWTSGRLAPGVWTFAVAAFDTAGNVQASPPTTTATIAGPPRPPAADGNGQRLTYTLATGRVPTLHWLASP